MPLQKDILKAELQRADSIDPDRALLLRYALASAGLTLFAATWRLWTPQTVYPQVPLFGWACQLPRWLDWCGAGGIVASLLVVLFADPRIRGGAYALGSFAFCLAGLMLLDQHRIQPWAYQFLLIAIVLAVLPSGPGIFWLRVLTVSIYFHSAVTKLDASFLETLGQRFLDVPFGLIQVSIENWPLPVRGMAAAVFPVGELLIAVGLCLPRVRRGALAAAIAMHFAMFLILGPWGLQHRAGVLIWNVFFAVQDWILFGRSVSRIAGSASNSPNDVSNAESPVKVSAVRLMEGLIVAAVLLPLLEPWGLWDHWPGWGLYASRAQRVTVFVHEAGRRRLPREIQAFLISTEPSDPWQRLRIDRWSLDVLAAPIYPQSRFQLGVAAALDRCYGLNEQLEVDIEEAADRWTGERSRHRLRGGRPLAEACEAYWFNGRPRTNLCPYES